MNKSLGEWSKEVADVRYANTKKKERGPKNNGETGNF